MTTASNEVATGKIRNRRRVRYANIDEMLRDVDTLVVAENAGRLRPLGNWTLGQAMGHAAAWADYAFDGYPPGVAPPLFIRWIVRFQRNKYLHGSMPAGLRIPRLPGGTRATEVLATAEGQARICKAFDRLKRQDPGHPNPVFGPLTHEEWIALNLRHAELHFSFFVPDGAIGH